jgi:hypothetical protein
MAFSYHDDYDRAMSEVLADTPSIELAPALKQRVTLQNGESIGYKVRHKDNPHLGACVVFHSTAFDIVYRSERLRQDARERARHALKALCESWSHHALIEVR